MFGGFLGAINAMILLVGGIATTFGQLLLHLLVCIILGVGAQRQVLSDVSR